MNRRAIHLRAIQRAKDAWEIRNTGKTLKEVGLMLKPPVTTERARQLVRYYERCQRYGEIECNTTS